MKLIGKGSFTKCYLLPGGKKVRLVSTDPIKEGMAIGLFPSSRMFPKVSRIESGVYEMKYYPKVHSLKYSLDPDQYELYKLLRKVAQDIRITVNMYDNYSIARQEIEKIKLKKHREPLLEAIDAACNYDSTVTFEISPRNVAVHNGKLILLDCFFLQSHLKEVRGTS